MYERSPLFGRLTTLVVGALIASFVVAPRLPVEAAVSLLSTDVADATAPSITDDGRWVVFEGTVGERQSVFRTDRTNEVTIELSPVPESVRDGATIRPQISADGCVVVAITEIAYDLFRDDDRDERWDVYRLVVPECGGQPNGWELVSTADRSDIARDGVATDSTPALSGSGALIAFVHQAPAAPDGVNTISVIDITVPINEPGRVQTVAGMPIESPNRAFLYHGARDPVLSQNGRHLAFVSDTTASEALPGWAEGPELGGYATSQVYVWDRGAADQREAVHLVSGRDGQPSAGGGADPDMSEDGRIVVFTSPDRLLVTAELPTCDPDCATQIYRFDRDDDGNGIFDEPPRSDPLALVSAVDAGVVEVGVPLAGDDSSWAPAVNADGTQIAFVTDATNLLPSRRGGGGGPDDGDLLVAEFVLGQIRRVIDGAESAAVPGAHGRPDLSKTGQVIAFDTMVAEALTDVQRSTIGGTRNVVTVEVQPRLSLAALDFGTTLIANESTEMYATVLNSGPAAFEPSAVTTSNSSFRVTGGTCVRGVIVAAGSSCSVNMTFSPIAAQGYSATMTVHGHGSNSPSITTELYGAAGEPTLLADPGGVDLAPGLVGSVGGRVAIDIDNIGFVPTSIARIGVGGANPDDFEIVEQSCTDRALNPDASCTIEVEFRPSGPGYRSALLSVFTPEGAYTSSVLGGFSRYEPRFETAAGAIARPGGDIGVGGSGFPANSSVRIGFDDGSQPFDAVETDGRGAFQAIITLPGRLRLGERRLVASSAAGAVANWTIQIEGRADAAPPILPGFGMG